MQEEAAGGGETSRNAELVFSATCLTVHVLCAADSAGQASATADVQQGVSAFHEVSKFNLTIYSSIFSRACCYYYIFVSKQSNWRFLL